MPSKKKTGIVTAALLVGTGAVAVIITSGDAVKKDTPIVSEKGKVFEKDVCTKAVRTESGKLVRIVRVRSDEDSVVEDTDIGRAVVLGSAPRNSSCHAMIDAPIKKKTADDGVACRRDYADVEELIPYFGKLSCPVMIPGSEKDKSFYWSMILPGGACVLAGDLQSFRGSDMHDFIRLPMPEKRRFLRTEGQCSVDGGFINCTVPVGDPRAVKDAPVQVPHGWAGRMDLNYVRSRKGKPDLRYKIPEEGFDEVEAVEAP